MRPDTPSLRQLNIKRQKQLEEKQRLRRDLNEYDGVRFGTEHKVFVGLMLFFCSCTFLGFQYQSEIGNGARAIYTRLITGERSSAVLQRVAPCALDENKNTVYCQDKAANLQATWSDIVRSPTGTRNGFKLTDK